MAEVLKFFRYSPDDSDLLGKFGDSFGAVNALLQALVLSGVIYTAILQKKELTDTRDVLIRQADALGKQAFENRFFQLLNLHHGIVRAMDLRTVGDNVLTAQGPDCLRAFVDQFRLIFQSLPTYPNEENAEIRLGYSKAEIDYAIRVTSLPDYVLQQTIREQSIPHSIMVPYMIMYNERQNDLGHYFRNLYHVLRFVHRSELPDLEKRNYAALVRAQLSSQELVLLFYNALGPYGYQKFKLLLEEYSMLKNLDYDLLLDPKHIEFYNSRAFAGTDALLIDGRI